MRGEEHVLGEAVQVEPMKSRLKAPGPKRLKLRYDNLLSSFAFKFNLRRYTWGYRALTAHTGFRGMAVHAEPRLTLS